MRSYSVEIHFDAAVSERIARLITDVAVKCGNRYMLEHRIPAHLTVAYFAAEDVDEIVRVVEAAAADCPGGEILFPSIGAFVPAVLFLNPSQSDWLWALNRAINTALESMAKVERSAFYVPNHWVPHATIACQLSAAELRIAFDEIAGKFSPMRAIATRLAIVECEPYGETIAQFVFSGS